MSAQETAQPAAPATESTDNAGTFEQRYAAIKADVLAEEAKPKGDKQPGADTPKEEAKAPPKAAEADEAQSAADARRARIEALRAKEAKAEESRQKKREQRSAAKEMPLEIAQRLAVAEQRAERMEAHYRRMMTPDGFLEHAEALQVDPMQVATLIREQLSNPEKVAARRARLEAQQALSPFQQRVMSALEEKEAKIAALEAKIMQKEIDHEEARVASELVSHVSENVRIAPYSAGYLEKYGQEKFLQIARVCAESLPEGSGLQSLHDEIESRLEALQLTVQSQGKPSTPKNRTNAAAKANTVSNALASKRTAVADEDTDFGLLPFDERLRVLRQRTG